MHRDKFELVSGPREKEWEEARLKEAKEKEPTAGGKKASWDPRIVGRTVLLQDWPLFRLSFADDSRRGGLYY
jgi:hypothetical protein